MGRRKRKTVRPRKSQKTVPKIFNCPSCGKNSINIELKKPSTLSGMENGEIKCSHAGCGLTYSVKINFLSEPVDAYADFIDAYFEEVKKVK